MKKNIIFISLVTLCLTACGSSEETSSSETTPLTTTKSAMEPGELLIVKSDCVGCHKRDEKMIGPSYEEIAAKYPSNDENINLLADKIIKGGKGVWGAIPMTPHLKITEDEAKLMAKYILSLKK